MRPSESSIASSLRWLKKAASTTLIIGLILRICMIANIPVASEFSFSDYFRIFGIGALNDLCLAMIIAFVVVFNLAFVTSKKYEKKYGYAILGAIVLLLAYLIFFDKALWEFNRPVYRIVIWLVVYKLTSFAVRFFLPRTRQGYSRTVFTFTIFLFFLIVILNAVGEYFFWDEFGVRYNFIAVDYLIYTNEVIGNIFESYPILPISMALSACCAALTCFTVVEKKSFDMPYMPLKIKIRALSLYVCLFVLAIISLPALSRLQTSQNVYANELQASGPYKFYTAFFNRSLEYSKFYPTITEAECREILNSHYNSPDAQHRVITDSVAEVHKNIVLIMMESLSADFMEEFGNQKNLTPTFDSLYQQSLAFERLYANGNRSVRGLEALTLCLPPSPGESLIKRQKNENLYSIAGILKERGYQVNFIYGGDSHFDNMREFFGTNGYEIIDRTDMTDDEITFSTVWGACDGDLFRKAIKVFDEKAASGKPFFGHLMTTSNHRPFKYPDNVIDKPGDNKNRQGAIRYSDQELKNFLEEAQKKDWYKNTVFVITADHCASSAGKTEVPVNRYHIPAIIYAPGFVQPQKIEYITSQMDIVPTVFGLLHFSYTSRFYGTDILQTDYIPRAVIATYQNLGYLQDSTFTVFTPIKKIQQFELKPQEYFNYSQTPTDSLSDSYIQKTIANYQLLTMPYK